MSGIFKTPAQSPLPGFFLAAAWSGVTGTLRFTRPADTPASL